MQGSKDSQCGPIYTWYYSTKNAGKETFLGQGFPNASIYNIYIIYIRTLFLCRDMFLQKVREQASSPVNQLRSLNLFLCPLQTSANVQFSDVFRGTTERDQWHEMG